MKTRLLISSLPLGLVLCLLGASAAAQEPADDAAPDATVMERGAGKSPSPKQRHKPEGADAPDTGAEAPKVPPRPRLSDDGADAASPDDASAAAAARARLRRNQEGDEPEAQAVAVPRPPRVRKTYRDLQSAVADASDGYKKLYDDVLRAKVGRDFTVELVDDDGSGGSYDVATKKIRLARRALDGSELVDTLLFESFNAGNQAKYEANLRRIRAGEIDLKQFGEQRADIELDTVVRYVKALNQMVRDDPAAEAQLPARARRARDLINAELSPDVLDRYTDVSDPALTALKQRNRTSPHDPEATSGRFTLPTAELYRYERVEGLRPAGMISMLLAAVQYEASSDRGAARAELARAGRTSDPTLPRTSIYLSVLDATEAAFPNDRAALEGYRFSPAMRRIAEEEAAQAKASGTKRPQ